MTIYTIKIDGSDPFDMQAHDMCDVITKTHYLNIHRQNYSITDNETGRTVFGYPIIDEHIMETFQ